MGSVDVDVIKHMLQALEHMLDTVDRTSILAGQLVRAQQAGKPLAPPTPKHYEEQLLDPDGQREQMRSVIARWWTLIEERQ